jgi:general secretion pathway protein D
MKTPNSMTMHRNFICEPKRSPNVAMSEKNLTWIRIFGTFSSLLALIGFIALFTDNSFALDPPGGFQSGGRTFNNPYSAPSGGQIPQPGMGGFDEEDEDYEMDYNTGAPPASARRGGSDDMGGSYSNTTARPTSRGGVSIGGSEKGNVVEGPKSAAQPYANTDDEGDKGSNEVITDFNFPDADIMDIAKALGKLTGKNFILDKEVKGKISIVSNSPITVKEAWRAFLTALDMTNFALIPSGKFIRIARQRDARDKQLRTYTGNASPDSDALITRLFKLKYLSADEVARNFRSFMPANSRIIPYEQTNTVIVTDTGSNIAKLNKLLDILDIEGFDAGIEVIPVKFASAAELAKLIDQLIPGNAAGGANSRFAGAGSRGFTARKTKEGGIINTVIADERTNNLIVHANSKGADQIRGLLGKLDRKTSVIQGGGKVHVVYLQFADAEAISNTLNNISTNAAGAVSRPSSGGSGASTGVNPVQATLFEGNIKVAPDKTTNSLVVTASPADFATVQRVINRLDIPRDQVYAEVVIMEMSVNKGFDFSASIVSPQGGTLVGSAPKPGDLANFVANPLSAAGAIIGFGAGNEKTIKVGGQDVKVKTISGLIKALQTNANANVVATPQILTMDNTEAVFESRENVPVATTQVAAAGGISTNSFTKEPVSISIKIKPSINKMSNFVKLDIDTKLEDFSKNAPDAIASQARGTSTRMAKTVVTVADGDTVVLGGLTRDKKTDSESKVPLLGDIPILGWLFKSRESTSEKSNLLIFITPKIIRQYESIRTVLDQKLKERDEFIEASAGGDDLARPARDKMIRSLPSLDAIKNSKTQTNFTIDKDADQAAMGNISSVGSDTSSSSTNSQNNGNMNAPMNQPQNNPNAFPGADPFGNPNGGVFDGGGFQNQPIDNAIPLPPPPGAADFGG